jgi:hypothetical protein
MATVNSGILTMAAEVWAPVDWLAAEETPCPNAHHDRWATDGGLLVGSARPLTNSDEAATGGHTDG